MHAADDDNCVHAYLRLNQLVADPVTTDFFTRKQDENSTSTQISNKNQTQNIIVKNEKKKK